MLPASASRPCRRTMDGPVLADYRRCCSRVLLPTSGVNSATADNTDTGGLVTRFTATQSVVAEPGTALFGLAPPSRDLAAA